MAAEQTQILKRLTQVQAAAADFNKVTGGLKEIRGQAVATAAAAVNRVSIELLFSKPAFRSGFSFLNPKGKTS
jgi:hypothetical protein